MARLPLAALLLCLPACTTVPGPSAEVGIPDLRPMPDPWSLAEVEAAPAPEAEPQPEAVVTAGGPAIEAVALPPGCEAISEEGRAVVTCAGATVVVEIIEHSPDLEALTRATLDDFKARGALAATWASPACRLAGDSAECTFLEAHLDGDRIGVAYIGVVGEEDRIAVRCTYVSEDRDLALKDPICPQLLEMG